MKLRQSAQGLSLVEIVVSAALLAVVMVGLGSTYLVVQRSQYMTKERLAAQLAAQSMIEEIDTFVALNPSLWDPTDTLATGANDTVTGSVQDIYNGTGFDVFNSSYSNGPAATRGELGRGVDISGTLATGAVLQPATNLLLFPNSRTMASPAVQAQAGYIEITQVGTRDLMQVDIVIAWQSYGGDSRVVYSTMIGPKT